MLLGTTTENGPKLSERILSAFLQMPHMFQPDQLEVVANAKDIPADCTVWKGAAIMSCLGTAQEFWISSSDWSKAGLRLLRERAPFPWL